jgi:hypothetical protein
MYWSSYFPIGQYFSLNTSIKKIPSGLGPKYYRLLFGIFLLVSFPPMFDLGESFKEHKGDFFSVRKFVNKEITF